MSQVLGGIRVNSIIWFVTLLTLSSLYICWKNCDKQNPTIMDTAMEYPFTIIFRVGMLYSLFLYFMIFLFIKWWLDSSQFATRTKPIVILSTLGLLAYALFVSCIDRKRINYPLAKKGVFVASICISPAIYLIMYQIKKIRECTPLFIGQTSWILKRITCYLQAIGMFLGVLIYVGQMDIQYKNIVEYEIVISTILFIWTFVYDFKRFKMDIDRIPKQSQTQTKNVTLQEPAKIEMSNNSQNFERY